MPPDVVKHQNLDGAPKRIASASACCEEPPTKCASGHLHLRQGRLLLSNLIVDHTGNVEESYTILKKIGDGGFSIVSKAISKQGGLVRAVKTVKKLSLRSLDRFKAEIAIMKMMDHPNIVKLYETFEYDNHIDMVMELCQGGELYDRIIEAARGFSEKHAAILVQQIGKAVHYMHQHLICHRDLKPENFLFQTKDPIDTSVLKLIDFGLSREFTPGEYMYSKVGTPYYMAPEMLNGRYDELSDMWGVGAIMYELLRGCPPFFSERTDEVVAMVKVGKYDLSCPEWMCITESAKDLIKHLLDMDPKHRYTADKTLCHDWIANTAPHAAHVALGENFASRMRQSLTMGNVRKAVRLAAAKHLQEDLIKPMLDAFASWDTSGDGELTVEEMKEGMLRSGIKVPADLPCIFEAMDSNGDGRVNYTEFLAGTLDWQKPLEEDACRSAFRVFDKDGDGKVTPEELMAVLGDAGVRDLAGQDKLGEMMREVDCNGDGVIDYDEFRQMMHGMS